MHWKTALKLAGFIILVGWAARELATKFPALNFMGLLA